MLWKRLWITLLGFVITVTGLGGRGVGSVRPHAAATASCHCAAASALNIRSVDREMRRRGRLNVFWTALHRHVPWVAAATPIRACLLATSAGHRARLMLPTGKLS